MGSFSRKTPLWREQFGEDALIGEELQAKEPSGDRAYRYRRAKQGYLALKQNFDDLGDYDAVNWAYRKERRMRKCEAFYGKKYSKFAHALVGYVTPDRAEDQSSKRHHLLNGDYLSLRSSVSRVIFCGAGLASDPALHVFPRQRLAPAAPDEGQDLPLQPL